MKKSDYEVEIPKGTGRVGFIRAIEAILKMPRVQEIHIDAKGKVTCSRLLLPEEKIEGLNIDFDDISPYGIIRNSMVIEVEQNPEENAAMMSARMFTLVANLRLYPIAFVVGSNTNLWKWFKHSTGLTPPMAVDEESFMGLPLHRDRVIDDDVLFLCTGQTTGSSLIETHRAFKVLLPEVKE